MERIDPSRSFLDLKAFLLMKGVTLAAMARKRGFKPLLFQQMARQYWGTQRQPQGILTDRMLTALREEMAQMVGEGSTDGATLQASNS